MTQDRPPPLLSCVVEEEEAEQNNDNTTLYDNIITKYIIYQKMPGGLRPPGPPKAMLS